MYPCKNCLENFWKIKKIENEMVATCQICGYEVRWDYEKWYNGKPCSCGTKVIFKSCKMKQSKLKKSYYYTGYFKCPKCKKIYFSDKYKVNNEIKLSA